MPSGRGAFVAEGYGVERVDVMYNDFVIVGPGDDPAGIGGGNDAVAAMAAIAGSEATFASRGDDSGTTRPKGAVGRGRHRAVRRLVSRDRERHGATLNTAAQMPAYTLTDRATWLSFENRGPLEIVVEGDGRAVQPVWRDPRQPGAASAREGRGGTGFIDWLQAHDRAHGGGLAHAVAAHQGHHLAVADVERDVEQHLRGAIAGLKVPDGQHQASSSPR
jgi:tungstate transport system substrate-binding protein